MDNAFSKVLTHRITLVYGSLLVLVTVVCTQVPRLNVLGYEFAMVMGLVAGVIGGVITLHFAHRRPPGMYILKFVALMLGVSEILLIPPLVIMMMNAWIVPNCSFLDGLLLYLLIPGFSVVFSVTLASLISTLFSRRPGIWYAIVIITILLWPLSILYFQPQTYVYNHLFGFFMGLTWDRSQPPFIGLLVYRALTLGFALLFVGFTVLKELRGHFLDRPLKKIALFSVALGAGFAIVLSGFYWSDDFGLSTSTYYLEKQLGSKYDTQHFVIIYSRDSFDSLGIRQMAVEHEFRLDQVGRLMGITPAGKITSYLYPDAELKKRLLGTASSDIARPWQREIHLTAGSAYRNLAHELVHVLAGEIGPYLFHSPVWNVGLTEGLAIAVEDEWEGYPLHALARAMLDNGLLPDADAIIGTAGFITKTSSISYVASGSFVRFLIDKYGWPRMKQAYAADDLKSVYGHDVEELSREWKTFLDTNDVGRVSRTAILYYFSRPSLFSAVCPRIVGDLNDEGRRAFSQGNFRRAAHVWEESEKLAPNSYAAWGLTLALQAQGKYDSVRVYVESLMRDTARFYSVYPLLLLKGDACWETGDSIAAVTAYSQLLDAGLNHVYSERARFHRAVLQEPALRGALWNVFRRTYSDMDADSLLALNIHDAEAAVGLDSLSSVARILLARFLIARKEYSRALDVLAVDWISPSWMYDACVIKGTALFYMERYGRAKLMFERAQRFATRFAQERKANTWLQRTAFCKKYLAQ